MLINDNVFPIDINFPHLYNLSHSFFKFQTCPINAGHHLSHISPIDIKIIPFKDITSYYIFFQMWQRGQVVNMSDN